MDSFSLNSNSADSLLGFNLSGRDFAISMQSVVEVVEGKHIAHLPYSESKRVKGIANVRGRVLPVVNVAKLLSLEEADFGHQHCLVVVRFGGAGETGQATRTKSQLAAFQVTEVTQVGSKNKELEESSVLLHVPNLIKTEETEEGMKDYEELDLDKLFSELVF